MSRHPSILHGLTAGTIALSGWLTATFWTAQARADEPVPPESYDTAQYPPSGTGWTLAAAGAGVTAAWYGGAVGLSYLWPDAPAAEKLRYPVVGPWVSLANTGCPASDPDCSLFWVVLRAVLTTVDGIGQAGGLALMAEAAFVPTARPEDPPPPRRAEHSSIELRALPYVSEEGAGLGVFGRF